MNAFLINSNDINEWCAKIRYSLKKSKKFKNIKKNAISTAKKYTWNNRAKNIIQFIKKND